jgi:hypothetical protein
LANSSDIFADADDLQGAAGVPGLPAALSQRKMAIHYHYETHTKLIGIDD